MLPRPHDSLMTVEPVVWPVAEGDGSNDGAMRLRLRKCRSARDTGDAQIRVGFWWSRCQKIGASTAFGTAFDPALIAPCQTPG
jgi:hypothetical protein